MTVPVTATLWSRHGRSRLLAASRKGDDGIASDEQGVGAARSAGDELGAGAALALAVATAALLLAMLVVAAGTAAIAQTRAAAAADAAALAAADALSGFADGSPCELAHAVARASGARLASCRIAGLEVRVRASVPVGPLTASADARAGPPS